MTEPTTEAGRRLLADHAVGSFQCEYSDLATDIAAIETEAAAAALAALRVEVERFRAFGVSGDYDRALDDVLALIARATEADAGEESRG